MDPTSSNMLAGEPSTLPSVDALSDDEMPPTPKPSGGDKPVKPKVKPDKPKNVETPKAKVKSEKPKAAAKAKEKAKAKVKVLKKPSTNLKRPAAAVKPADTKELDTEEADPPQPAAPAVARRAYLEYRKQNEVYSVRVKDATTGKKPEWIRVGLTK